MPDIQSESFVFDPRPNFPLVTTANRYWATSSRSADDPTALTLIFAHGTGFHKEIWLPIIEDLYTLVGNHGGLRIREVWSIDAPNHGDAAVLNEKDLQWGYEPIFRWEDYGRVLHSFLAGLGKGVNVDFTKHRLVGIGHSMGAISMLLSTNFYPSVKFESIVLVEPMIFSKEAALAPGAHFLSEGSAKRRDAWPSKEEAYTSLKSRKAWQSWDDRVLRIYVDKGMRPLPTAEYPDKQGVTLKCTRKQETASYNDPLGHSLVYRNFAGFTKRLPVHLMYGEIDDYVPWEIKDNVINKAGGGVHNFASFAKVPSAGHLAPQTNPKGVAQKIYEALAGQRGESRSKL